MRFLSFRHLLLMTQPDQKTEKAEAGIDLDTVSLLVPKAKAGSETARNDLLAHIQDYVGLMARNQVPANLRAKFGASDIVQQSLAQVIRRFDDFRGDSPGQFYAWLRTIVNNEVKQIQRDFHRNKRNVDLERKIADEVTGSVAGQVLWDHQPTPGTNAIANEELKALTRAMERLSPDDGTVIRLRSLERLPFKEVAEQMDRSVGAVTQLWYRAIMRLEREMTGDEGPAKNG